MKTSSKNKASKIKRYVFKDQIGKGNFANVWKAIDNTSYTFVAIKAIESSQIEAQPKVLELLQSEINILKEIDHPNVVKLYDSFEENGKYYLVMEYCNGGDLEKYVKAKKDKCLSEDEVLGFFKQLLNGFKALHSVRAMHRDFKLANVLMNDGLLKIADLGFSKQADLARTALGTGVYMAPEIMKYQRYNNKVDIWSLAICLYEMLFGKCPFFGRTENELLVEVEKNVLNFNVNGKRISEEFQNLIRKMLVVDPEKRMNWIEIYKSPLLNSNDKASATLFFSRGEAESQHQNLLFQKNKDFYENKKNLEYDNTAMMKERNERKKTPVKKPDSDSEDDEEQTLKVNKITQKAKATTPQKTRPKDSDSDDDERSLKNKREDAKKTQKEKQKAEEDEEATLKIKRGNNKVKKAEENTLKREKKKGVDSDDSDISEDRKKENTIARKNKEKREKEVEDPKNKEKTKLANKNYKEKSPLSKGSEEEMTMERPKYKKKEIVIDDDDNEEKTKTKKGYEKKQIKKSDDDEEGEKTLVKNKYGKKSPENQKKALKNKDKSSSSDSDMDEMTRDNRLINKKEKEPEKKIEKLEKKIENDKKVKNSSSDENEEQTMERKRALQKKEEKKDSKKETLKKQMDSDEEEEKSIKVKQNLINQLSLKNEAWTILEKKYLHRRNIISHHAKILEEGIKLSLNQNAIYTYFILSKRLQMLALGFSNVLEEKENCFNEPNFFRDFVSSRDYSRLFDLFNQQKEIYSTYLKQLKEQIEKYETYQNPLFDDLKNLFLKDDSDISNLMFKQVDQIFMQVLMDFSFTASDTITAWKGEKHNESKEKAKKYAIHIIKLVDCCLYLQSFPFDEKAEAGFNFRMYEEDLEKLGLDDLDKNLEKRKELLLSKI